jgi:hypothetical protein
MSNRSNSRVTLGSIYLPPRYLVFRSGKPPWIKKQANEKESQKMLGIIRYDYDWLAEFDGELRDIKTGLAFAFF